MTESVTLPPDPRHCRGFAREALLKERDYNGRGGSFAVYAKVEKDRSKQIESRILALFERAQNYELFRATGTTIILSSWLVKVESAPYIIGEKT